MRVEYAELDPLLLVRLLPYGEKQWRYWVYNKITRTIVRIDAIGEACVQLPEGHGIIFPGGYYLQNGEHKTFDISMEGMRFKRVIKSPNGEDVLYIFYEEVSGCSLLLMYDVISRELAPPILAHGHARMEDGRMVIFHSDGEEQATRIHPMQVWATPFYFDEYADRLPPRNGFYGRIGNAELVRGISDFYEVCRDISSPSVSIERYTLLTQNVRKLFDAYHWLSESHVNEIGLLLRDIAKTSEAVLDEYEKVESIRAQSSQKLAEAQKKQESLLSSLYPDGWNSVQEFVNALNQINAQRGLLLTIRDLRYMDTDAVAKMETRLLQAYAEIATATSNYLATDKALQPFSELLQELAKQTQAAQTVLSINEPFAAMQNMANDLDMLTSLMGTLQINDATQRTHIIESISEVYAKLNQSKARAEQRKKELGLTETVAQFGAQFQLFGQSVVSALSLALDPEKCDEQLSRLLIQLEEIESQFGTHEEFLNDILTKREEVLETFEARKQNLLDERQRKAQNIQDAALRILETLPRRIGRLTKEEEINSFFAADPLILKLKELIARLQELHDSMRADDIDARIKSARDQALRALRDKTDLFENDGNIIRLGSKHRFSVNTQELDLTILPRQDQLYVHLTGTEYFERIQNPELGALKEYWLNTIESETPDLYRGEYLAAQIILTARDHKDGLTLDLLKTQLPQFETLNKTVRDFATPRYKEGYEKGIHDHDAALILSQLIPVAENAGLLRFPSLPRALAGLYWSHIRHQEDKSVLWIERARTSQSIQKLFHLNDASTQLQNEIAQDITSWVEKFDFPHDDVTTQTAAEYLLQVLSFHRIEFVSTKYAKNLYEGLRTALQSEHIWTDFEQSLGRMQANPGVQWLQVENALKGMCQEDESGKYAPLTSYIPDAIILCLLGEDFPIRHTETDLFFTVSDMMGTHPRLVNQQTTISVDGFFERVRKHLRVYLPNLQRYHAIRQNVMQHERDALRLDDFKPKPLTTFVRNKLINDVYLPVIGDNLAKQIGTVGENKRTDLMGLLMLISPPGYGKTTLMEYIAHRLGLIFMKINGPALGHRVLSLDPKQAPDATSAQELEKLNLALEMGNNVMLYVDDIQHTSPEFLQKF
ncbi:MAG: DNA repair ATPase, partial [Saezia sp.]